MELLLVRLMARIRYWLDLDCWVVFVSVAFIWSKQALIDAVELWKSPLLLNQTNIYFLSFTASIHLLVYFASGPPTTSCHLYLSKSTSSFYLHTHSTTTMDPESDEELLAVSLSYHKLTWP